MPVSHKFPQVTQYAPDWGKKKKFVCVSCAYSYSVMSDSVTLWTVARQAPLSMGILQAGILEWVAMPFSRGLSQRRD